MVGLYYGGQMTDLDRTIAELRGECTHKHVQKIDSLGTKFSKCMACGQRGDFEKGPTIGDYTGNISHEGDIINGNPVCGNCISSEEDIFGSDTEEDI
jgi:hypothetical protein